MRIDFIRGFIEDMKEKYHISDDSLTDNGAIYYMNGNDGTDFDYNVNDMTCEFMCFYKSSEFGAIKVNQRGDKLVGYAYAEDDWSRVLGEESEESPLELYDFCCYLYGSFDKNDIIDEPIKRWNLTDYVYIDNNDEDEEDPFDSPYDEEDEYNEEDEW